MPVGTPVDVSSSRNILDTSSKQVGAVRQGNFVIALSVGLMWLSASGAGPKPFGSCPRAAGCRAATSCFGPSRHLLRCSDVSGIGSSVVRSKPMARNVPHEIRRHAGACCNWGSMRPIVDRGWLFSPRACTPHTPPYTPPYAPPLG